jgi:hypothetical protein
VEFPGRLTVILGNLFRDALLLHDHVVVTFARDDALNALVFVAEAHKKQGRVLPDALVLGDGDDQPLLAVGSITFANDSKLFLLPRDEVDPFVNLIVQCARQRLIARQ